jgi:tRNA nucleotidyltransferase (CCA-adding enzyme)
MDKIIKNILIKIENEGFEAYLVGGYVRDYLLGIASFDVDICTNALPKDLKKLFPMESNSNNYGGFNMKIKQYNIDITTYRKELKYSNRKPTEIIYINNLFEDIKRRDFTINALCMNEMEEIIDPLNAIEDIQNRVIKIIGNPLIKITEDPLRILRAIRFATVLDFEIDEDLINTIKENTHLVLSLSGMRVKQELNKILISKNCNKGLNLLKDLGLAKVLKLDYDKVIWVSDPLVMWAQIKCENIPFTKVEKNYIIDIRQIINEGIINNYIIYKYGLYLSIASGEYLGIDKKNIIKMSKKLPLKKDNDLAISSEEIIQLLNIKPSIIIKNVKQELIKKILNNELKNNNKVLKNYVITNKGKWTK